MHESRKEQGRSHRQEGTYGRDAHRRPDGEVRAGDEIALDAISDQEIKDDCIQEAREEAR